MASNKSNKQKRAEANAKIVVLDERTQTAKPKVAQPLAAPSMLNGGVTTVQLNGMGVSVRVQPTSGSLFPIQSIFKSMKNGRTYMLIRVLTTRGIVPLNLEGLKVEKDIYFYNLVSLENMGKLRASVSSCFGLDCHVSSILNGVSLEELEAAYGLDLAYIGDFGDTFQKKQTADQQNFGNIFVEVMTTA